MRYLGLWWLCGSLLLASGLAWPCSQVVETPRALPLTAEHEWAFVSQNLWHFNDDISIKRLQAVAAYVQHHLKSPHLLALQEVGSHDILQQLADVIHGQGGPKYETWLIPGPDAGSMHLGVMVREPLQVKRVQALFGELKERTSVSLFQRPPLLLELEVPKMMVVNVHQRSGIGLPQQQVIIQRRKQAEVLFQWVQQTYEAGHEVMVLGDVNSHLIADVFGEPFARLHRWPLQSAWSLVPAADKFSYIYRCQRQAIDHVLLTPKLWQVTQRAVVGRGNAGRYRPLYQSKGISPVSDHDAVGVYLHNAL